MSLSHPPAVPKGIRGASSKKDGDRDRDRDRDKDRDRDRDRDWVDSKGSVEFHSFRPACHNLISLRCLWRACRRGRDGILEAGTVLHIVKAHNERTPTLKGGIQTRKSSFLVILDSDQRQADFLRIITNERNTNSSKIPHFCRTF